MTASVSLPSPPRRWLYRADAKPDPDRVAALVRALRLPDAFCRLLDVRGHGDPEAAKQFLRPRLGDTGDPFLLAGMDAAVQRIVRALRDGETMLVHGDYDVDGICATALYVRTLRSLGGRVEWYVPHRLADGYDLGQAGVRAAARAGATLVVTGDCGIVAHEAVAAAGSMGVDVVVTDHHAPGDDLPPAVAVVNPYRPDCPYPHKELSGTGVAYKVCEALYSALARDPEPLRYELDLVALATIADVVPLVGENRILARFGLRVMAQTRNPGLRALIRSAGLEPGAAITAGQVGFVLAPRLNAAGRLGDAGRAVRLLLAGSELAAAPLAQGLELENRQRRSIELDTLEQALARLERDYDPARDYALVLDGEGWHPGVIGIVASRLVERMHRPAVLIAWGNGAATGRGSARSIRGFHLRDALAACAGHLDRFGGHRYAAGLEIRRERIDAFRSAFNDQARSVLGEEDLSAPVEIDLELPLSAADPELLRYLPHLGPFGVGNPAPVFCARAVRVAGRPRFVGPEAKHVRLEVSAGRERLPVIGFGLADRWRAMDVDGAAIDIAFQIQEDRWRGRLQAKLVDFRHASG